MKSLKELTPSDENGNTNSIEMSEFLLNNTLLNGVPNDVTNIIYAYLELADFLSIALTSKITRYDFNRSDHRVIVEKLMKHFNQRRERAITHPPATFRTAPLHVIRCLLSKERFQLAHALRPHDELVTAVSHSHMSNSFVLGLANGAIQLFEQVINNKTQKTQLKTTRFVASDNSTRITDVVTGHPVSIGHVTVIAHSQNTQMFITGTGDKKCQVWEKDNNNAWHKTVLNLPSKPREIIISPTDDSFVVGCQDSDNYDYVIIMSSKNELSNPYIKARHVRGYSYYDANHVCFGPEGKELFIGNKMLKKIPVADGQSGSFKWAPRPANTESGRLESVLGQRHTASVISHSPSGRAIITAAGEANPRSSIVIWQKVYGRWLFPLSLSMEACISIYWRSSSMFKTQDERTNWQRGSSGPLQTHPALALGVNQIVFSPNELSFLVIKSINNASYIFQFQSKSNDSKSKRQQKIFNWRNDFGLESENSDAEFTYIVDEIGTYNGKTYGIVFSHDGSYFVTKTSSCLYIFTKKDNINNNEWEQQRIDLNVPNCLKFLETSIFISPDDSYIMVNIKGRDEEVQIFQRKPENYNTPLRPMLFSNTDSGRATQNHVSSLSPDSCEHKPSCLLQ
jgi:hypothetical protein